MDYELVESLTEATGLKEEELISMADEAIKEELSNIISSMPNGWDDTASDDVKNWLEQIYQKDSYVGKTAGRILEYLDGPKEE